MSPPRIHQTEDIGETSSNCKLTVTLFCLRRLEKKRKEETFHRLSVSVSVQVSGSLGWNRNQGTCRRRNQGTCRRRRGNGLEEEPGNLPEEEPGNLPEEERERAPLRQLQNRSLSQSSTFNSSTVFLWTSNRDVPPETIGFGVISKNVGFETKRLYNETVSASMSLFVCVVKDVVVFSYREKVCCFV